MLTRLSAENFKCLRKVDIGFSPLTVLIGPNDSGKSTVLEAIILLERLFHQGAVNLFREASKIEPLVYRRDTTRPLVLSARGPQLEYRAELLPEVKCLIRSGGEVLEWAWTPPIANVAKSTRETYESVERAVRSLFATDRYRLSPHALRTEAKPTPGAVLSPTGDNLVAVLDAILTGRDLEGARAIQDAIHKAIPTLRGVSTPVTAEAGTKTIEFVLAGNGGKPVAIPSSSVSDGAMLMTAFLALAYSDTPDVLLVEEPENGLHPSLLGEVVSLLRKMTTGEVGNRPRQVVLTTHSPLLLNFVAPEEVRVLQRDAEMGTTVTPMHEIEGVHEWLKEFSVGELWYLLGERALVKGERP